MRPVEILPLLVEGTAPETAQRARELALELGCPLLPPGDSPRSGLALRLGATQLELLELGPGAPVSVSAEFVSGPFGYRLRQGFGRRQPLGRALGLGPGSRPRVVDATAGLGRDTMLLAILGCTVQALERSAVVVALLQDGLRRATGHHPRATAAEERVSQAVSRIELIRADARQWLRAEATKIPIDVVFLDPMFPERRKSALVKKEMRLFRRLIGEDPDGDELLQAAFASGIPRIVVKRPRGAPFMGGPRRPNHSHDAGVTRYDVYLSAALL